MTRMGACVVGVLGLMAALAGCKKDRATGGGCPYVLEDCEAACKEGNLGDKGCVAAANEYERRVQQSKNPAGTADGKRAIEYYSLACQGGDVSACRDQARLRSPQWFYASPDEEMDPAVPTVEQAWLDARVEPVREACAKKPAACVLLGDLLIGADTKGARAAYETGCKTGSASHRCKTAMTRVDAADSARAKCAAGSPTACACLASIVIGADPPRAAAIVDKMCRLRFDEPAPCYSRQYLAIHARAKGHKPSDNPWGGGLRPGLLVDPCAPAPEPVPAEEAQSLERQINMRFGALNHRGALEAKDIMPVLETRRAQLLRCYHRGLKTDPNLTGRVRVRFVIDRTGEMSQLSMAGSDMPNLEVVDCVTRSFRRLTFKKPATGFVTAVLPTMFLPRR